MNFASRIPSQSNEIDNLSPDLQIWYSNSWLVHFNPIIPFKYFGSKIGHLTSKCYVSCFDWCILIQVYLSSNFGSNLCHVIKSYCFFSSHWCISILKFTPQTIEIYTKQYLFENKAPLATCKFQLHARPISTILSFKEWNTAMFRMGMKLFYYYFSHLLQFN